MYQTSSSVYSFLIPLVLKQRNVGFRPKFLYLRFKNVQPTLGLRIIYLDIQDLTSLTVDTVPSTGLYMM